VIPYARHRRKSNTSCRAAKANGVGKTIVLFAYFRGVAALERCVISACERAVEFATRSPPTLP